MTDECITSQRDEAFSVSEDILTRSVTPARGTPYQHTCDQDVFENVAHAIDERGGGSFTYEQNPRGRPFHQQVSRSGYPRTLVVLQRFLIGRGRRIAGRNAGWWPVVM